MLIRLRLAMHGIRNRRIFHLVAIDASKARNARPLEKLGVYDPHPSIPNTDAIPMSNRIFGDEFTEPIKEKRIEWDSQRIKWWLSKGAQPTETVIKLLEKGGLLEPGHPWDKRHEAKIKRKEAKAKFKSAKLEAAKASKVAEKEQQGKKLDPSVPDTLPTETIQLTS